MANKVVSSASTPTCSTTLAPEPSSTWRLTTPAEVFSSSNSNNKTLPVPSEVRHFRHGCSTRRTAPVTSAPTAKRRRLRTNVVRGQTETTTETSLPGSNLQSTPDPTIEWRLRLLLKSWPTTKDSRRVILCLRKIRWRVMRTVRKRRRDENQFWWQKKLIRSLPVRPSCRRLQLQGEFRSQLQNQQQQKVLWQQQRQQFRQLPLNRQLPRYWKTRSTEMLRRLRLPRCQF